MTLPATDPLPRTMPSGRHHLIGAHRDRAERYLVITIAAFAVTIAGTRWYLELTGYPTIGGGELHVAHVLWGGLALFLAALVMLLFVGRRAVTISALLAGVGVGLFIDEVGKFLTTTNDYFFAPAAPIIYGSILLLVLLWLLVRRRSPTRIDAAHAVLEALRDGLDGRLSESDRERVAERLRGSEPATEADDLSSQLLAALESPAMDRRLTDGDWVTRGGPRRILERILPTRLERWLIYGGLALSALTAVFAALILVVLYYQPKILELDRLDAGRIEVPEEPIWTFLSLAIYVATGLAAAVALGLRVMRSRRWLSAALVAVLIDLVVGELIAFYAEQFAALGAAVSSVILLALVIDLRIREANAAVDEVDVQT